MSNRIKDLNAGGDLQLTDLFGVDRASPDETFNLTGQMIADGILPLWTQTEAALGIYRIQANLLALADITSKAIQFTGKFYDIFDGNNTYSEGQLDDAQTTTTGAVLATDTNIPITSISGFVEKSEITIQDSDSNSERRIIDSINSNSEINFSSKSYDSKSFAVSSQDNSPQGIAFNDDGSKLYMGGNQNKNVHQYTLSTEWDISSASFTQTFVTGGEVSFIFDIKFSPDGTKMYLMDNSKTVEQYTLSTAWDVSSASYDSKSYLFTTECPSARGFEMNPDGTKMYACGNTNDTVYQYTLSTPFDVSTGSYASKSLYVGAEQTQSSVIRFNSDGKSLFVSSTTSIISQFVLSTPYDVSTGSWDDDESFASQTSISNSFALKSDDLKFYVLGTSTIFQYTLTPDVTYSITVDSLTNGYSSGAYVYRSLGTISSNRYVMDDTADFTTIDVRYNIAPFDTITEFVAWVIRDKLTGFSTSGAVSIVDSLADESFDSVAPTTIELDASTEEDEYVKVVTTAEDKITFRITMIRALDTDDAALLKILGAIN